MQKCSEAARHQVGRSRRGVLHEIEERPIGAGKKSGVGTEGAEAGKVGAGVGTMVRAAGVRGE